MATQRRSIASSHPSLSASSSVASPASHHQEPPQRSRNARAQARHRAKRKAYIEQLEQTVQKLQSILNVSPEQVAALPPLQQRMRELESHVKDLQESIDKLCQQIEQLGAVPAIPAFQRTHHNASPYVQAAQHASGHGSHRTPQSQSDLSLNGHHSSNSNPNSAVDAPTPGSVISYNGFNGSDVNGNSVDGRDSNRKRRRHSAELNTDGAGGAYLNTVNGSSPTNSRLPPPLTLAAPNSLTTGLSYQSYQSLQQYQQGANAPYQMPNTPTASSSSSTPSAGNPPSSISASSTPSGVASLPPVGMLSTGAAQGTVTLPPPVPWGMAHHPQSHHMLNGAGGGGSGGGVSNAFGPVVPKAEDHEDSGHTLLNSGSSYMTPYSSSPYASYHQPQAPSSQHHQHQAHQQAHQHAHAHAQQHHQYQQHQQHQQSFAAQQHHHGGGGSGRP